jgi:hypothetical protein
VLSLVKSTTMLWDKINGRGEAREGWSPRDTLCMKSIVAREIEREINESKDNLNANRKLSPSI